MKYVFMIAILLFAGCSRPTDTDRDRDADSNNERVVLTDSLKRIRSEFQKLDKEDQDTFYKLIAGSTLYIKNAANLNKSSDFQPVLAQVQSSYLWEVEKYPRFTDAISEYLIEEGYDQPRELKNSRDRQWLYNIFNSIYTAIKI